jgi:hypothetical protein
MRKSPIIKDIKYVLQILISALASLISCPTYFSSTRRSRWYIKYISPPLHLANFLLSFIDFAISTEFGFRQSSWETFAVTTTEVVESRHIIIIATFCKLRPLLNCISMCSSLLLTFGGCKICRMDKLIFAIEKF